MASTEVDRQHGDEVEWVREPSEAPSARFGWSGEGLNTFRIAGIISAIALLVMMIGNHAGKVEDIWLIGFAVVIVALIARDALHRRGKYKN